MRRIWVRWGRRILLIAVGASLLTGFGATYALADVPVFNGEFTRPGALIYPDAPDGLLCRLFGRCVGTSPTDVDQTAMAVSQKAGDRLHADCRLGNYTKLTGFLNPASSEVTVGWTLSSSVRTTAPVGAC
jgi:hypothetical protein